MKSTIFVSALILTAILSGCSPSEKSNEPGKHPNVLFFFADDQRAYALGCSENPYIKTPNIGRLAETGVRFSSAYVMGGHHGAICAPSRAMLMSGKSLFHVYDNLDGVKTMPMHFAEQGYETFGTGNGTTECSRPATPPHADLTIFTVFARDTGQKEPVHAANDSDLISKENYSIWKTTPDNMKMFLKNSRRFQITCYKHKNIGKIHK